MSGSPSKIASKCSICNMYCCILLYSVSPAWFLYFPTLPWTNKYITHYFLHHWISLNYKSDGRFFHFFISLFIVWKVMWLTGLWLILVTGKHWPFIQDTVIVAVLVHACSYNCLLKIKKAPEKHCCTWLVKSTRTRTKPITVWCYYVAFWSCGRKCFSLFLQC